MATEGSMNTDVLSDEIIEVMCTMCDRKGRNSEAEKYCMECSDYYCVLCVKVHEDVPSLIGHKILDKGRFPSSSSQRAITIQRSGKPLPAAPTERCDRHSHYVTDLYCQNHDDVGCANCMTVDHRSCKGIFYIPEFLQNSNNANTTGTKGLQKKLRTTLQTLTYHHDNLQGQKQQLLKSKADTLAGIKNFRREINDRLDELEKNSADEVESIYEALITEIEKATNLVQTNKTNVMSVQNKLTSPCNNQSQYFVNAKKGKMIVSTADECTKDGITQIEEVDTEFEADKKLYALLEEVEAFGKISQRTVEKVVSSSKDTRISRHTQTSTSSNTDTGTSHHIDTNTSHPTQTSTSYHTNTNTSHHTQTSTSYHTDTNTSHHTQTSTSYHTDNNTSHHTQTSTSSNTDTSGNTDTGASCHTESRTSSQCHTNIYQMPADGNYVQQEMREMKEYNVKVRADKHDCHIVSACNLEDGTVLLADFFNMKLKRLDSSTFTVTDFCKLGAKPWQVCAISDNEVAVCLQDQDVVQFISVGRRKLLKTNRIKFDFSCYGMAYANSRLYVSDYRESVYVYTLTGEKLRKFSKDQSGQNLFSAISSLAANKDGSRIYLSDYKDGLIVLDKKGKVVGKYNGPALKGAFDCCLTKSGAVIVSGCESKNVLIFGPNAELGGQMLHNSEKNQAVCLILNKQMSKVILGRYLNNCIQVGFMY